MGCYYALGLADEHRLRCCPPNHRIKAARIRYVSITNPEGEHSGLARAISKQCADVVGVSADPNHRRRDLHGIDHDNETIRWIPAHGHIDKGASGIFDGTGRRHNSGRCRIAQVHTNKVNRMTIPLQIAECVDDGLSCSIRIESGHIRADRYRDFLSGIERGTGGLKKILSREFG